MRFMAVEAPKSKSLLPEVGINALKGLLAGTALLVAINLATVLHPLIVIPAIGGAIFGVMNWIMSK